MATSSRQMVHIFTSSSVAGRWGNSGDGSKTYSTSPAVVSHSAACTSALGSPWRNQIAPTRRQFPRIARGVACEGMHLLQGTHRRARGGKPPFADSLPGCSRGAREYAKVFPERPSDEGGACGHHQSLRTKAMSRVRPAHLATKSRFQASSSAGCVPWMRQRSQC